VWQVTLCDPVWHVTSRSGEAVTYLLTYVTACDLEKSLPSTYPLPTKFRASAYMENRVWINAELF